MARDNKILVIGDDPVTQELLQHSLSMEGFQIFAASGAANVLFNLCLVQPDLIVLDALQPGVNGAKLLQWIRKRSNVPVVVISALAEHSLKLEWLNEGADDFLAKPFNTQELKARIRSLLRRIRYTSQSDPMSGSVPATAPSV